jgi:hypothetical protein
VRDPEPPRLAATARVSCVKGLEHRALNRAGPHHTTERPSAGGRGRLRPPIRTKYSHLGRGAPLTWAPDRIARLSAEIDACYARLCGLTRDELSYIVDRADVYGEKHASETFWILKNTEARRYGDCRNRRVVIEAWDHRVG